MVKYLEASFRERVEERVCKANRQWNLLVDNYADLGPSGLSPKTKQYALYAAQEYVQDDATTFQIFPLLYVLFRAGLYSTFSQLALLHPDPAVHQLGLFL